MKRLFFGLTVDEEVAARIQRTVRASVEELAVVQAYSPSDLHLTLAFLGNVENDKLPSILEYANEEFRGLTAPELRVGGWMDAFPSQQAPRALFTGVEETFDTCGRLAILRNRAMQVGLVHGWRPSRADRERPYRPHVTVARVKDGEEGDAGALTDLFQTDIERAWLPVDVTLFESLPRGEGGEERYATVAAWPLVVRPG